MKENLLKMIVRFFYRDGSTHRILFGPLAGLWFRVNNITRLMPLYSGNEPWHQRRFKALLRKGSVVIDIGANWGLHALYASKLVGAAGKVIAFEPFLPAFSELEWHTARNGCRNIIPINCAIGEIDGEVAMYARKGLDQGVVADCVDGTDVLAGQYLVKQKKLDTVIRELHLKKVNLIKIDVEGAEEHVLKGAEYVIDTFRPFCIIDLHDPAIDLFVAQWFTSRGYTLKRLNEKLPPVLRVDRGWPDRDGVWDAILAIP